MESPRHVKWSRWPGRCLLPAPLSLTLACLLLSAPALAFTVKGTVQLDEQARSGRLLRGYWRLENGVVPVTPPPTRGDTVVVVSVKGVHAPAARTVSIDLRGMDAEPRVVVVGPGSVVEFKNTDRVAHDLSIPDQTELMPPQMLNPGTMRRVKFSAVGGYAIRCAEFPHIQMAVLVVDTPYFARVDDKGGFSVNGIEGDKATVQVWSQNRWVHKATVDLTEAKELTIKVEPAAGRETAGE